MRARLRIVTPLSLTVQALGFLALAVIEFAAPWLIDRFVYRVLLISLLVSAVLNVVSFCFVPKRRMARTLVTAGMSFAALVIIWRFPWLLGGGAGVAFGLWAMINAAVRLGYAVQLKCTKSPGALSSMIEGLLMLLFGAALVVSPIEHLGRINWVLGVYFVFLSLTLLGDAVREFFRWDIDGRHFRKRIRITPPVLLTAFLPSRAADEINRLLKAEQIDALSQLNGPEGAEDGPLEVFFHMGKDVAMGFGHVDFCLRDTFYSYGCYDAGSNRAMNLLSDGVLAISPRDKYLRYSTEIEKKTMVGFTLYLTEEQEKRVECALDGLMKITVPWIPENTQDIAPLSPQDFVLRAGTRFFKITQGPYKTYNTVRTNCVALAELLVGETGLPIMQTNGIITPGTYLAYMEREFARKNSLVVKKTVYRAEEK